MRASYLAFFVSAAATVGCGGKVIFDDPSGQGGATTTVASSSVGSSGGGGIATGVSIGSGVADSSVSSGSGGLDAECAAVCQLQASAGCETPGCVEACESADATWPQCAAQFDALLQCFISSAGFEMICASPENGACGAEYDAWLSCSMPPPTACQTVDCSEDNGGDCSCDGFCNSHKVEATCDADGCACSVDGKVIGDCDAGAPVCDLSTGCCSALFDSVN